MEDLHPRQRAFVEAVAAGMPYGRAYEAAGYSQRGARADQAGSRLAKNAKVAAALAEVQASAADIADQAERQRFLSDIMRDADQSTRDRLRACELLARMGGDFIERSEVDVKGAPPPVIVEFVTPDMVDDDAPSHHAGPRVVLPSNGREGWAPPV